MLPIMNCKIRSEVTCPRDLCDIRSAYSISIVKNASHGSEHVA